MSCCLSGDGLLRGTFSARIGHARVGTHRFRCRNDSRNIFAFDGKSVRVLLYLLLPLQSALAGLSAIEAILLLKGLYLKLRLWNTDIGFWNMFLELSFCYIVQRSNLIMKVELSQSYSTTNRYFGLMLRRFLS
jgi:hypothetical protein